MKKMQKIKITSGVILESLLLKKKKKCGGELHLIFNIHYIYWYCFPLVV